MANSMLLDRLIAEHQERAKTVAKATLRKAQTLDGEAETAESRRIVAGVVQRVKELAGLNLDQFADAMGKNGRQVGAWIEGRERPHFDAIEKVTAFKPLLMVAWAEALGCAEIETTIKVPMRRISA